MKDYYQVRDEILTQPAIRANMVNDPRRTPKLRGTNMMTENFACFVEDEDGDVAEISFTCHTMPLGEDPVYGVTYANFDACPDMQSPQDVIEHRRLYAKNECVHSIEELVAKLYPGMADLVESMHRHPSG